jgi:hypothetical protein
MTDKPVEFTELLKDAPKNWGRWGADDERAADRLHAWASCSVITRTMGGP